MSAQHYTNARGKVVFLDIRFLPDSEAKKLKSFTPENKEPEVLRNKRKEKTEA